MDVVNFLRKASEKCGYKRERYADREVPDDISSICVLLYFGDIRFAFVSSSLLLHRWMELKAGKYFIVCSYPNWSGMFPYVNEFWSLKDEGLIRNLITGAIGSGNLNRDKVVSQHRMLVKYFEDVSFMDEEFGLFYKNGFTKEFFEKFKKIVYKLPNVGVVPVEFSRKLAGRPGHKVVIFPHRKLRYWAKGRETICNVSQEFWIDLCNKLMDNNVTPVVVMDEASWDVSPVFESRLIYLSNLNVSDLLSHLRSVGCVMDFSQGVNRLATMARCPFISLAERHRHNELKEFELDDITCSNIPYKYVFGFPTMIEAGRWDEIIQSMLIKLNSFLPELNRDQWMSTLELSTVIPYSVVRKKKSRRIGTKFIKVPKL